MKIFVTGAGGFIGSRITRHLSGLGHEVAGHVRSRSGDLTMESIPPDTEIVVNSAGRLGKKGVNSGELASANESVPAILGDFCSINSASLIHISTPGVTGLLPAASEDMEYRPWGEYESSKMRGELTLLENSSLLRDRLTILRPDFVYGPGDLHKLPLFRQAASGWFPLIGRNGARIRPTYCEDVCRAVEESLPGGILSGGLYNIGGPLVLTLREVAKLIADGMGRKVRLIPLPRGIFRLALLLGPLCPSSLSPSRFRLFGEDHYVSTDKAEKAGFRAEWPPEKGLRETAMWYVREGFIK